MSTGRPKYLACFCAVVLAFALLAGTSRAEDSAAAGESQDPAYWTVSFLGGLLTPRKKMRATHDQSLLAGARMGWTSRSGLGIELTADYSPLPRDDVPEGESFETHFAVATATPRFTVRWKKLRFWAGAGGGAAVERTTEFAAEAKVATNTKWAAAAVGSAGVELHLLASGGLAVAGSYARLFRELGSEGVRYEFVNLTGGLVFVFY